MAKSKTIEIKVEWHKATETPKKNAPIYLLFKVGKAETQEPQLPIMWAYASQIGQLITDEIVAEAKFAAWAWYKED